MQINQLQKSSFEIRMKYKEWFEKEFLLTSDRHWDNPLSNWALQRKHLDYIKSKNWKVIDCWDFFCAMQWKYDKRANKNWLRPEHQTDNYLDSLVNTAVEWFAPYADNFAIIWTGNHETSVLKRNETDLIWRLVTWLNSTTWSNIYRWQYQWWIRFVFDHASWWWTRRYLMHFSHWYWGWWAVTKWVIQTSRRAVYLPEADIIINWHIHESWIMSIMQERVRRTWESYLKKQYHVSLPTYKEEYLQQSWYHIENWRPPKPLWAYILKFKYSQWEIKMSIREAD